MPSLYARAIVLAAGKSSRFQTKKSKVLHTICGQTIIRYPLSVLDRLQVPVTLVLGHQASEVQADVQAAHFNDVSFVMQQEQRGTGHALACTREQWDRDNVIVLYGDMPLVSEDAIASLFAQHASHHAAVTFVTSFVLDPTGYGRVVEHGSGYAIVEEKNCNEQQRGINRINAGIYVFSRTFLHAHIDDLQPDPLTGEIYLVDLVRIATQTGQVVHTVSLPYDTVRGVNTLQELWGAEQIKRSELMRHWMSNGVRFELAQSIHLDLDVQIGAGTTIGAGVHLLGKTAIGQDCSVGPFSIIENSTLADEVTVYPHSIVQDSSLGVQVRVGPFAHVRTNSSLASGVQIGNFVEVKHATIGQGSRAKHLAYLGDAQIGAQVNVGAGTITCNYDGVAKHQTTIQDGAFIGSNNTLVAPVVVGKGAYTAAGSTITHDVPDQSLAIGRARQTNKEGYARKLKQQAAARKNNVSVSDADVKADTCGMRYQGALKTEADIK